MEQTVGNSHSISSLLTGNHATAKSLGLVTLSHLLFYPLKYVKNRVRMFNVKWMSISWSQLGRGVPDKGIYIQFPKTIFLFSCVLLCSLCSV